MQFISKEGEVLLFEQLRKYPGGGAVSNYFMFLLSRVL